MNLARFAAPLFVWTLAAGLCATPGRAQVDGDLDPSFFPPDGYGVVLLHLGEPNFEADTVKATVVQPDGKIVLETLSLLPGGDSAIGVARLNSDGSTDLGFGNNGVTYLQLNGYAAPGGLLLQPDGRIVVGGTATQNSDSTFLVARLTSSGLLDTTFNAPWGYRTFDFFFLLDPGSYHEGLAAMALQTDGKIVLVGDLVPGTNRDMGVVRLNGDGSVDMPFGGELCGCTSVAFDLGGSLYDYGRAVAIDSGGNIVVAGQAHWGSNDFDWAIFRLTPGGLLDTSFNGTGSEILPWDLSPERTDIPSRIVTLADGRFVVGGTATVDEQGSTFVHAKLARFGAGGGLDPTFGPAAHPGQCDGPTHLNADHVGLAADAHGHLWVGYESIFGYGAVRLDADCQPVFPVAAGGQTFDVLENGFGDLVVGSDQRVVVTGTTYGGFPGYRDVGVLRLWVVEIFRDGFESANTSRWSSTVP